MVAEAGMKYTGRKALGGDFMIVEGVGYTFQADANPHLEIQGMLAAGPNDAQQRKDSSPPRP